MSKSKVKKDREKSRAGGVDHMVTYLECADFKSPLPEYYPLLRSMLDNCQEAFAKYETDGGHVDSPTGVIAASDLSRFLFSIFVCAPAASSAARRTMIEGAGMRAATAANSKKVVSVVRIGIREDGGCSLGLPGKYFSTDSGDWLPAVPASSNSRTVYSGSPAGAGFKEVTGEDTNTIVPRVCGLLNGTKRALWSVKMGAENGRSRLVFLTSEAGVKGFFDLRSAPYTGSGARRAALMHFVRTHLRSGGQVREHFRGAEEFQWFGLSCQVVPPETLKERVG